MKGTDELTESFVHNYVSIGGKLQRLVRMDDFEDKTQRIKVGDEIVLARISLCDNHVRVHPGMQAEQAHYPWANTSMLPMQYKKKTAGDIRPPENEQIMGKNVTDMAGVCRKGSLFTDYDDPMDTCEQNMEAKYERD